MRQTKVSFGLIFARAPRLGGEERKEEEEEEEEEGEEQRYVFLYGIKCILDF